MPHAFDEMSSTDGAVRPAYETLQRWLAEVPQDVLDHRRKEADFIFRRIGITFAVYGEQNAQERLIPFDIVPRILTKDEWTRLSRGLEQRVKALNMYIKDVYSKREILKAGIVPENLVYQNPAFRPEMNGQRVPHDLYVHIAGIDIVRTDDRDKFYVLEDNAPHPLGRLLHARKPRRSMMRLFPDLFADDTASAPVENYPDELLDLADARWRPSRRRA